MIDLHPRERLKNAPQNISICMACGNSSVLRCKEHGNIVIQIALIHGARTRIALHSHGQRSSHRLDFIFRSAGVFVAREFVAENPGILSNFGV